MTQHTPFLLFLLLLGSCSGSQDGANPDAAATEDTSQVELSSDSSDASLCKPARTIGQPCSEDCECLSGLCLLNEWAPFRFCSADCTNLKAGDFCPPDSGLATSTSLCVPLSSEFNPPPNRFCVPLCIDGPTACKATANPWETCEIPTYKLVPLLDTTDKVCSAPSAHGHAPINPDTCEGWEPMYQAWEQVATTCAAYCLFLDDCRLIPADALPACCQYACARYVAPVAAPDPDRIATLACLNQAWSSYQKTALACTKPEELCGEPISLSLPSVP